MSRWSSISGVHLKKEKSKLKPWETREYLVLKIEKWRNEINIYFNFTPLPLKKNSSYRTWSLVFKDQPPRGLACVISSFHIFVTPFIVILKLRAFLMVFFVGSTLSNIYSRAKAEPRFSALFLSPLPYLWSHFTFRAAVHLYFKSTLTLRQQRRYIVFISGSGYSRVKTCQRVTMGPESRAQADRSIIMDQVRRESLSTQLNAVHHVVVRFVL